MSAAARAVEMTPAALKRWAVWLQGGRKWGAPTELARLMRRNSWGIRAMARGHGKVTQDVEVVVYLLVELKRRLPPETFERIADHLRSGGPLLPETPPEPKPPTARELRGLLDRALTVQDPDTLWGLRAALQEAAAKAPPASRRSRGGKS